jgi:hypothetical protein
MEQQGTVRRTPENVLNNAIERIVESVHVHVPRSKEQL